MKNKQILLKEKIKLKKELEILRTEEKSLKLVLDKIFSSKAYKFWQHINLWKKKLKRINIKLNNITLVKFPFLSFKKCIKNDEWGFLSQRYEQSFSKSLFYIPYIKNKSPRNKKTKLIAFYFPQFHLFPENEHFWGKGFTDWINTSKAVPLFKDHYQPRIPDELGFYDLKLKENLKKQIRLAKNYGIYGFCFHYYWFIGKPVMTVVYNHILSDPSLDIPFCLHWANEPWTVRWDGFHQKGDVLLNQVHYPTDDIKFIKSIEPALKDKRYIRINGRPLLIIYRPSLFPNIKETIKRWNDYCTKKKIAKLYLAVMQTSFEGSVNPNLYGFDAAIEYPPHNLPVTEISSNQKFFYKDFQGHVFDYDEIIKASINRERPKYKLFRGVMPDWDVTPRRINPDIFVNNSMHKYQYWLEKQIEFTEKNYKKSEQYVFINAWNEWAEGAYLEPDKKYGYSYLQATYNALNKQNFKIAIVAHLFYDDLIEEFISYFRNIPFLFDIYVSTTKEAKNYIYSQLIKHFPKEHVNVFSVKNIGRDMMPFVVKFNNIYNRYDFVCWVHSKKSRSYNKNADNWRKYLLNNLLGSPKIANTIIEYFIKNKKLGLVFPDYFPEIANQIEWGSNWKNVEFLSKKIGLKIKKTEKPKFPAGSMFWFRPKALKPLFDINLKLEDFEKNSESKIDGTLAHAIERIMLYTVEKNKYDWKQVLFKPYIKNQIDQILFDEDINEYIKNPKIVVISHIYYEDIIDEIISYIKNIPYAFDLYITTQQKLVKKIKNTLENTLKNPIRFVIKSVVNRGFDIAPFLNILPYNELKNYDFICKIHGKKSSHTSFGDEWRRYLLNNLLGSEQIIKTILYLFIKNKKLGMIYPKNYSEIRDYNLKDSYRENWNNCVELANRLRVKLKRDEPLDFPSGSMFWAKPKALKSLFYLNLKFEDFEKTNKLDGNLAHAIERMFALSTKKSHMKYKEISLAPF